MAGTEGALVVDREGCALDIGRRWLSRRIRKTTKDLLLLRKELAEHLILFLQAVTRVHTGTKTF